jgi:hypothetical protein
MSFSVPFSDPRASLRAGVEAFVGLRAYARIGNSEKKISTNPDCFGSDLKQQSIHRASFALNLMVLHHSCPFKPTY